MNAADRKETDILETDRRETGKKETDKKETDRNGTDMVKFGGFVKQLRTEKGLTQRQLAEKLFLSNKAVSKWETGQSMPDISLLNPLAEVLGCTVAELLEGQRLPAGEAFEKSGDGCSIGEDGMVSVRMNVNDLTEKQIAGLMKEPPAEMTAEKKRQLRFWYFAGLLLSAAETVLLFRFREVLGFSIFDISMDMFIPLPMFWIMGIWIFFFLPERLPALYDKTSINNYSNGCIHISMGGVSLNNKNWPHITRALRAGCFLIPVCWPAAYVPIRLLVPDVIWTFGRMFPLIGIPLGGILVPAYAAAVKNRS